MLHSLFLFIGAVSQELVPNGGFEVYKNCPEKFLMGEDYALPASGWYNLGGFPDYFNKCSSNTLINRVNPRSGEGCMGIVTFWNEKQITREFLSINLQTPLTSNQLYCVKFYVALSKDSELASSYIGMLFTSKLLSESPIVTTHEYVPQIVNRTRYLTDTSWTEISGIYRATGGEKSITIGNFVRQQELAGASRSGWKRNFEIPDGTIYIPHSHYLIDDVSIIPISNEFECSTFGKPIILNDILFDPGKSILLPVSYKELDKLSEYLIKHTDLLIEINGHTDSLGNVALNKKLSTARAKAVFDYLVSKGISKKRINYKGFGGAEPLVSNLTEEGRRKNRRVQFTLYRK